jgi:drug/metabolite transporter (DMT)-like permease
VLTYVLAVLAACANATSSVLQRKANRKVPGGQNMSLRLIWSLLHEPVWFGGVMAVTAGFLLQATALGTGQLAVVEPILVVELPLTLLLASRVFGSRLHWREWVAIAVMTAGLAGLLYFLAPSAGRSQNVVWYAWVIGGGINLGFIGVMIAWSRARAAGKDGAGKDGQDRRSGGPVGESRQDGGSNPRRAAVLGVAAGSAFGLTAALMKGMTTTFSHGFGELFTSWQLYAMILAGAFGMFLLQSALQAGRLIAAQPGITLSDPTVSILWGILVFHEEVRGGLWILGAVLSGVALVLAVLALARSPLLAQGASPGPPDRGQAASAPEPAHRAG